VSSLRRVWPEYRRNKEDAGKDRRPMIYTYFTLKLSHLKKEKKRKETGLQIFPTQA
jgi:hypothetical protein